MRLQHCNLQPTICNLQSTGKLLLWDRGHMYKDTYAPCIMIHKLYRYMPQQLTQCRPELIQQQQSGLQHPKVEPSTSLDLQKIGHY